MSIPPMQDPLNIVVKPPINTTGTNRTRPKPLGPVKSREPKGRSGSPKPPSSRKLDDQQVAKASLAVKDMLGRPRVSGLKTNGEGVNPKDRIGASKVDLTVIPYPALVQMALGLMEGVTNYGPYNWRKEPVQLRTYLAAALRHIGAFLEDEQVDPLSEVHHLGHAMACCAIIIDAMNIGSYVDDRPIKGTGSNSIQIANTFIKEDKPAGWGR